MPDGYADRIRLADERDLEAKLAKLPWHRGTRDEDEADRYGPGVPLSRELAPRTTRLAALAAKRLGFTRPYELSQATSSDLNGSVAYRETAVVTIRLMGSVATRLDDGALLALIGHEIGHAMDPGDETVGAHFRQLMRDAPRLAARYSVTRELTADRFGLLACQDLHAVVRLEATLETHESAKALELDEAELLRAYAQRVQFGIGPIFHAGGTHPSPAFRTFATQRFFETDVYRELTGTGPATRKLVDVDAELGQLCREAAAKWTPPAPAVPAKKETPVTPPRVAPSVVVSAPVATTVGPEPRAGFLARARAALVKVSSDPDAPSTAPQLVDDLPMSAFDDDDDPLEQRFKELEARAKRAR